MCTGFARRGNDVIMGFNMDIDIGAWDYKVYAENDRFYVGMTVNPDSFGVNAVELDKEMFFMENNVRKAHGVNSNGCFGNLPYIMDSHKGAFRYSEEVYFIDQLVDDYISGRCSFDNILKLVSDKDIVNLPNLSMHSLIADAQGRFLLVEPGNGYSVIREKYAAISNFSLMELPGDFITERFGYYGKDRYDRAMEILRNSNDDFSVSDGLRLLDAVKQVGTCATRVSFVYSRNENAIYYAIEGDFENIIRHQFR